MYNLHWQCSESLLGGVFHPEIIVGLAALFQIRPRWRMPANAIYVSLLVSHVRTWPPAQPTRVGPEKMNWDVRARARVHLETGERDHVTVIPLSMRNLERIRWRSWCALS